MELYVHIPFCLRKCLYCDFLSFAAERGLKERYIDALVKELGSYSGLLKTVPGFDTVFIGGGTPSILDTDLTEKLLSEVSQLAARNAEFTIECNPGTLDKEKLGLYRRYGVNRISMGLQSADNTELKELGRIHEFGDFERSFNEAREAGFENINVDLMSGLPGQSVESFEKTLETVAGFDPEHISVYSLIIEPGTVFYERYGTDNKGLPDEDEDREMYHRTGKILSGHGYQRYEISNYAKKGFECLHNLGYWKGEEYLGAGIGAASYYNGERFKNTDNIERYIGIMEENGADRYEKLRTDVEKIDENGRIEEYIILRLRLTEGIDPDDFSKRFGFGIRERFGAVIDKHTRNGLLITGADGRLKLSERGLDLANTVMSDFIDFL